MKPRPFGTAPQMEVLEARNLLAVNVLGTPATVADLSDTNNSATLTGFSVDAGSDRLIVVAINMSEETGGNATNVTFGGQSLTPGPESLDGPDGAEIWYGVLGDSSTATTGNVEVGFNAVLTSLVTAIAFDGVDQASPVSGATTGNAAALTVASATGDMVIDAITTFRSTQLTVGAGQTAQANETTTVFDDAQGGVSTEPGAASVDMGWSGTGSGGGSTLAHVGLNLRQSVAVQLGSIHGLKFEDLDGDGQFDPGEPTIDAVEIELSWTDPVEGDLTATTTTGPNGEYSFEDLDPDIAYQVREVIVSPWVQSTPDPFPILVEANTGWVANQDQADALRADGFAGEIQIDAKLAIGNFIPGSIHGYKFYDINANGVDDSEPRIPGITIQVEGYDVDGNRIYMNTVTNASGEFSFEGLPPSVVGNGVATGYSLYESESSGYVATAPMGTAITGLISTFDGTIEDTEPLGDFDTVDTNSLTLVARKLSSLESRAAIEYPALAFPDDVQLVSATLLAEVGVLTGGVVDPIKIDVFGYVGDQFVDLSDAEQTDTRIGLLELENNTDNLGAVAVPLNTDFVGARLTAGEPLGLLLAEAVDSGGWVSMSSANAEFQFPDIYNGPRLLLELESKGLSRMDLRSGEELVALAGQAALEPDSLSTEVIVGDALVFGNAFEGVRFDLGSSSAAAETAFDHVGPFAFYNSFAGFGWQFGGNNGFDRGPQSGVLPDLRRDGYSASNNTFLVDVPNDTWTVTVVLGDPDLSRSNMTIEAEGAVVATDVDTAAGEHASITFDVAVSDGQLNLDFGTSSGGSFAANSIVVQVQGTNALTLMPAPADVPADGTSTIQVNGQADANLAGQLVTVTTELGTIVSADASPEFQGIQAVIQGDGSFRFDIQAPTLAAMQDALVRAVLVGLGGVGESTVTFSVPSPANFGNIVVAPDVGGGPNVRTFDGTTGRPADDFEAYAPTFTGGVRVATGDVNRDGIPDIITGAGVNGNGHVKVFDGDTGAEVESFLAFPGFTGGIFVAGGDVNNDGFDDIIVGADVGGGPSVIVFDGTDTSSVLRNFFAYDPGFSGGVRVAAGDVNNDGFDDI
ncbi:MAG: hypothetical protein KDA42_15060, partial [Planctomycetales bacterium]|nr:hypothetical protein [Planctomycetales bacterium]